MRNKNISAAHCTATILDFSYVQYSTQWQKIGNMQSSASSILTVISIIASLMVGVISQIKDVDVLLISLGTFSYSFYLSLIFSFSYLFIAAFFVYRVIKPKYVDVVKYASDLQEVLLPEVESLIDDDLEDPHQIALIVDTQMLMKVNDEIKNIHNIVEKNQQYYKKCLMASFLSLASSFIALGHVMNSIFSSNDFIITIVGIFGYLCSLGLIPIFYKGKI